MFCALLAWATVCIALVHSTEPLENSRRLIGVSYARPRSYDMRDPITCTDIFGPKCRDCNTLWTCVGGDEPIVAQKCAQEYPGQPYCVKDACTSEIDESDISCTTGIQCTAEGYFPSPTNCSQFYLCAGASGHSFIYECPSGYVYNPVDNGCKRKATAADCNTINCAANPNRYVVYTGDRAYYAFCWLNQGISNPIMFRCNDPENFKYDPTLRQCIFQCKAEGRVADHQDCQQYYECYRVGSSMSYVSRRQKCISGFKFDETLKRCVSGTCETTTTTTTTTAPTTNAVATTTVAATTAAVNQQD